ncbi:uncharacterized protein TNCV_3926721 [Trichonephila clavipes]|nr:uncharacterized protein TNCV_3926721 [Trichonephila clavipes]
MSATSFEVQNACKNANSKFNCDSNLVRKHTSPKSNILNCVNVGMRIIGKAVLILLSTEAAKRSDLHVSQILWTNNAIHCQKAELKESSRCLVRTRVVRPVEGETRWLASSVSCRRAYGTLFQGRRSRVIAHAEAANLCQKSALYGLVESFKNDEGHNVTVNGDRYRAMITNFFIPELNNHDVQELCFQKDGATCHTARATIDLLKDTFGDRLISRFGLVNCPSKYRDLTPLDYFLWGYVKSLVYADKPQTLDHLKDNIRRVIADIRPQMLEKVIENWTSRLDYIQASRGSPMPEIIFKM